GEELDVVLGRRTPGHTHARRQPAELAVGQSTFAESAHDDSACFQRLFSPTRRVFNASSRRLGVFSLPLCAEWGQPRSTMAATGPPPSGPWCAAETETKTAGSPVTAAVTPPTAALIWRCQWTSESSSIA